VVFNSVSGQTTAWRFIYQNETIAQFRANSYCNLYFNNLEQLRTLVDGVYFNQNIGIGTTSPSSKLDVRNGDITVYTTTANTGNWLYFRNDDVTTSTESTGLAWTFNSASTRYVEILVDYDVRATQGLLIHSGYPITVDATTQINFDLAGTRRWIMATSGLLYPNGNGTQNIGSGNNKVNGTYQNYLYLYAGMDNIQYLSDGSNRVYEMSKMSDNKAWALYSPDNGTGWIGYFHHQVGNADHGKWVLPRNALTTGVQQVGPNASALTSNQLEVANAGNGNQARFTSTNNHAAIHIHAGSDSVHSFIRHTTTGSNSWEVGMDASNRYYINPNIASGTTGSAMVINNSGDVGIGTISPDRRLHILENTTDAQVRIAHDASYYLDISELQIEMVRASTSTADLTIKTTNTGTWGSGGGDIILMPGGIAGGNFGDVGVGTIPYHLNNYRFLHIHHDTNGGGMVMSDNSNRRAAIYNGDANLYIDVTSTGYIDFRFNGTAPGGTVEFRMEADGDFHADGDVYAFSTTVGSDIALKKNVTLIDNALDKVSQLKGVLFDWKREDKGSSAGLIAQDVEKVLPELVKKTTALGGNASHKNLNYNGIIGLLVESIKELKEELSELKKNAS